MDKELLNNFFCRSFYQAVPTDLVAEISLPSTCVSYAGRPSKHVKVPKDKMSESFHLHWEKSLREAREPQSPKQMEELDSRPEVNNPPATGADNSPLTSRFEIDPQPNHIWVHCSIQVDSDSSDNSDYAPLATELEKEMASKHRQVEEENNGEDDSDGRVLVPSKLQQYLSTANLAKGLKSQYIYCIDKSKLFLSPYKCFPLYNFPVLFFVYPYNST